MTYVVTETCIDLKDKSCIEVCPVDCIHEVDEDRMVFIDPDECIDCGACVDPCPVDAIYAEEDVPAPQAPFTLINKIYFKDKVAARAAGRRDQAAGLTLGVPAPGSCGASCLCASRTRRGAVASGVVSMVGQPAGGLA